MKDFRSPFGLRLFVMLFAFSAWRAAAVVFTVNTQINVTNNLYEGQDLVVSNCVLTVDGPHAFNSLRLAAGATLNHTATPAGTVPVSATMTNEPYQLISTNAVILTSTTVVLSSVVVTDTNSLVVYTNTIDYELINVGGFSYTLARTTNSAIVDGDVVFVSYDYSTTINAGLNLELTNDFELEPGASVNLGGRGFGGNAGTGNGGEAGSPLGGGGAGHGGFGGLSSSNATGGNSYGNFAQPTALGSGGGAGVGGVGGAGGGTLRLIVGGVAQIDGAISVNGLNATNGRSGGGSGGSVWITAQTVSGAGSITAHGGNGEPIHGGGGGGGRIALYCDTNNFTGGLAAYGGLGWKAGGAGTIYTKATTGTGLLLVDNSGRAGANSALSLSGTPDVIIRGGAAVVPSGNWVAQNVLIASNSALLVTQSSIPINVTAANLTIESGGAVQADNAGMPAASGTGAGGFNGGGGGHGGYGGMGTSSQAAGGNAYGTQAAPITFGSGGGGNNTTISSAGAPGGGAIRLNISGTLQVDGKISANGGSAVIVSPSTTSGGGGGGGGSVWITAETFTGSGLVIANGGNGINLIGGGGGGGRIAIIRATNQFTGAITAYGGSGVSRGGAGTLFLQIMDAAGPLSPEFILDNGLLALANARGTNTPISPFSTLPTLIIRNGAVGQVATGVTVASAVIRTNSALVIPFQLTVSGGAMIEAGGAVHADGLGFFGSGNGSSVVISGLYYSGGGGHGGYGGFGGTNHANARGGTAYGSATNPSMGGGAGGGSGSSFPPFGGLGGGMLRFIVNGSLTNHGRISSDGTAGSGNYAGGGAGGGILLTVGNLYGSGLISANGGPGILPGGGGGSGGRIAVTFFSNLFNGTFTAYGGGGANFGGAGTIYLKTNQFSNGHLIVDNGGNQGTNTMFDGTIPGDLTVSGGGKFVLVTDSFGLRNVHIKTNGVLLTQFSQSQRSITLSGNMTIDAGGVFLLDGLGNGGGAGLGAGTTSGTTKGGGGHGGYGALNQNSFGNAYGSITAPMSVGSGGGNGSGSSTTPLGGGGGGALRLSFIGNTNLLTVNGRLSANGLDGELNSGGGSGGSLWITPLTLAGTGIISANGGAGNGTAGGGGGGRIFISYNTNLFTGQLTAFGGNGAVAGGAGTVYFKPNNISIGPLWIDNGGQVGTNTPLSSNFDLPPAPFNLTISGGASVYALTQLPQLSNLVINASSRLTMSPNQTAVTLNVLRDATIAAGGAINVDGKGFARSLGTGPGASFLNKGAGGGHGGIGGASQSGALGGTNYGSATQPVLRGSGGGAGANTYLNGCEGGGAIRLTVGGTLTVAGSLSANGNLGIQDDSGGGAGGSIWLTAGTITGNGNILAEGGAGDLFGGGGGGGGRIAIYSLSNNFDGLMSVAGGTGANDGGAGTVFFSTNLTPLIDITGKITNQFGEPVAGVLLQPGGGYPAASTITDANGEYVLGVPMGWYGTVTPVLGTNQFLPNPRSYASLFTTQAGQNYLMAPSFSPTVAMANNGTNLVLSWNGLPSFVYLIERSTNLVDWTIASGNFYGGGLFQATNSMDADPVMFFRVRGFY